LKNDDEEVQKPWETKRVKFSKDDFPKKINLVKANMLYVLKVGISQRALNTIKRLAAFKNPEFYKAQAMRMPTYNKPRVISCSDETEEYLCLPRGCEEDVKGLLNGYKVDIDWMDKTNCGRTIDVEFNGKLREDQQLALNELIKYDNGVLSATTAFGKTVVAARRVLQNYIKRSTKYLFDYNRRLFKKLQRTPCTLSIEAAAATPQMDFFNSLLGLLPNER